MPIYFRRYGGPLAGQPMEIDRRSSFTQGLAAAWIFDEGIIRERVRNLITAPGASMKTGVALIGGGPDGLACQRIGAAFTSKLSGPTISNALLGISNQMSIVCLMRSSTTSRTAFCRPAAATHTSPFLDFGFFTNGDFRMSTAGSSVTPSCGFALASGVWYFASITYDGTTVRSRLGYANPGTAALSGNVRDGGQEFLFGGSRSGSEDFVGDQVYVAIWNRVLEFGELSHLVGNPLAFMRPSPQFYIMPQASTAAAFRPQVRMF